LSKLKHLIEKHWDIISYLFFGVLTTLVDYVISYLCHERFGISPTVSTVIAWVAAVCFAFLTNKSWVFGSQDWSVKTVFPEFLKFAGSRAGSGLLVTLCIMVTVEILGWNFMLMKLATSVLNIVLNYIASKLLVFRDKKS
jgi:putative flippase GtrA